MTKRIKLKIQRNRLPDVDILWAVNEQEGREQCTISKLISDINHAIPLESGEWTLDQYIAELDGYECLHYQFVSDVLKDGDNLIVRPLASPDVKARRLGGRTQITGEGFHILDGVPYGMQPNQRIARPGILIPSRKRRRPELEEEDYDDGPTTVADLEDDEELLAHVNEGQTGGLVTAEVEEPEDSERPKKKQKNVHFNFVKDIPDFQIEEDDSAEEDDGEFEPEDAADSSDEDDSNDESEYDVEDTKVIASENNSESESSSEVSSTSEEGISSSDGSDSDASSTVSTPEVLSTKQPNGLAKVTVIPGEGTEKTRERNRRRRIRKKMHVHVQSILGSTATMKECSQWLQEHPEQANYIRLAAEDNFSDANGESEDVDEEFIGFSETGDTTLVNTIASATNDEDKLKAADASNGLSTADIEVVDKPTKQSSSLAQRRQDLLDAIASGGIVNRSNTSLMSIVEAEQLTSKAPTHSSPTIEASDSKRVRLDINGSRRAIFGALGQRTPKTQQDADRVRMKLASLGKSKSATSNKVSEQIEEDPLSDAWRSKIRLMAVDCDNPEITLTEPPYPFKQRWDPSQQRDGGWWAKGGKARKRKARRNYGQDWEENEGEYDEFDDASYLDFDEPEYAGEEEGAVEYVDGEKELADVAKQQLDAEPEEAVDDLPSLPADISTLPNLKEEDLKPGAVIAFKQLQCSQATNWAPIMSAHRTAEVLITPLNGEPDMRLAIRDRDVRNIQYDKDGKRLYEKFEMDGEDEGVDDGIRMLNFAEMVDAKLVRDAAAKHT